MATCAFLDHISVVRGIDCSHFSGRSGRSSPSIFLSFSLALIVVSCSPFFKLTLVIDVHSSVVSFISITDITSTTPFR